MQVKVRESSLNDYKKRYKNLYPLTCIQNFPSSSILLCLMPDVINLLNGQAAENLVKLSAYYVTQCY